MPTVSFPVTIRISLELPDFLAAPQQAAAAPDIYSDGSGIELHRCIIAKRKTAPECTKLHNRVVNGEKLATVGY